MGKTNNPTITVEVAPQTPAPPATTTPKPAAPVEQVTVPMRPAAVAAANLATTITAIGLASGTAGAAALAATALTGAALVRRGQVNRHNRTVGRTTRTGGGLGRMGLGGARRGLGSLGLGGLGRRTGAGKPTGSGHGSRGHGSGHRRNPLGGLTSALRKRTGRGGHTSGTGGHGAGHSGRGRSHGRGWLPGSLTGRGRGGHGTGHTGRTSRGILGRAGQRLARTPLGRAARRTAPIWRGLGKTGKALGIAGLGFLGFFGWVLEKAWKIARWVARKIRKKLKGVEGAEHLDQQEPQKEHVGDKVNRPKDPTSTKPGTQTREPGRTPVMAKGQGPAGGRSPLDHEGNSQLYAIARAFHAQVSEIKPRGNLEIRDEAIDLAAVLALIAESLELRVAANRKESLHADYHSILTSISAALYAVANSALGTGEMFDALHPERVGDLLYGQNPAGWDAANNGR
jgi:hypothetical protein